MTSAGGLMPAAPAAELPGRAPALGSGGRRPGRGRARRRVRPARRRRVRHGRHQHRRVSRPRRRARAGAGAGRSAGYPIRLPALDIHTIGAGGGSIARLDPGGALVVGPRERRCEPRAGVLRPRRRRGRPSPTPTSCSVASRPTPRSPVSAGSTSAPRAPALERAGVSADGVIAVVDAAMEQAVRVGDGRARRRPSRARARRVRWRRSAARVRGGRRARDADGDRAARGPGVFSAVGLLRSPRRRELVRVVADARRHRRARRRARRPLGRRRSRVVGGDAAGSRRSSTAATSARATSSPSATVDAFARRARAPQRLRPAPTPRSRSSRCGPARPRRRRSTRGAPGSRSSPGRRAAGRRPRPTARSGSPTAGRPSRARSAPGSSSGARRSMSTRPRVAAGADLARSPASPRRWVRCCAGPRSAPTSRSAPTARPRCSPPTGELLVQAEHIPVHLGSMPAAVRAAIDATAATDVGPGDQIVLNDPFAGGTHLNDVTLVAPAFVDDELVGWVANRAHHADLGGMAPGSMPPDALEIDEEGLRLPPMLLDGRRRGEVRVELAHARRAARRSRRAERREPARCGTPRALARHLGATRPTVRRDRRLRRAPHARRARRAARRRLARSTTCSTRRVPAPEQQQSTDRSS